MIARRVEAIVLAPADSKALVTVARKAVDAGIVVVNIDNRLDADAMAERKLSVPFVGPDNRKGARAVGAFVASKLHAGDPVAIIEGAPNAFNGIQRALGFKDAATAAGLVVARSQTAGWETDRANQVVTALIAERPDVKAILCANDSMALGAVAALRASGRTAQTLVAGFDNITAVQALVEERRDRRHRRPARRSARRLRHRVRARATPQSRRGDRRPRNAGRSRHRGDPPLNRRLVAGLDWIGLALVLVALVVVFGLTTRHFASWTTARALANQAPDTLLVATGMTLVIVTGGIDLSVGSVLALSAAVFGLVLTGPANSLALAAVASVLTGAAAGLVNGAVSVRWQLPTFLVTLGMLEMARGATYLLTDSRTMYLGARVDLVSRDVLFGLGASGRARRPRDCRWAVHAHAHGLRPPNCSPWARTAEAARLAGISPGRVRIAAFGLAGALAGLAAIVQAGRLAAVDPNAGTGLELDAIAAVVIGGTSLSGGRGSVVASALGALVILVLGAGLAQLGVQEPTRRLVTGGVIVAAAIVDHYRAKGGRSR